MTAELLPGNLDSPKEQTAGRRMGLRVLLAEGDAGNAEFMTVLLEADGHQVQVAPSGPAALRLAQAHPPDVVLLEIRLPGMDGCEVARRIREQTPGKQPFCVAITSYGTKADRRRCWEAGIDLHLLKPVDTRYLRGVLRQFQASIELG
jgi:CheY-like chemotaxis protein